MSRWHWLRHDWGRWEQYKQDYGVVIYPGEVIQKEVTRARIRQKRICATCGAMQDKIVAELHQ